MSRVIILWMAFLAAGCAMTGQGRLQSFYQEMDSSVGLMTFDDALARWGQPAARSDGDNIFISTWGAASGGTAVVPVGGMFYAKNVEHGWRLEMGFDKKARTMKWWKYNEW